MGWSTESQCSSLFEPQPPREDDFATEDQYKDAFTDYLEGWFEWWGGCITDVAPEEPVPPGPGDTEPPQPPCIPARWITGGQCWERICTPDGPVIRRCERNGPVGPVVGDAPRIESIRLGTAGFVVEVVTAPDDKSVKQSVSPKMMKLVPLVRAMFHGSQLPSGELSDVPEEFWAEQHRTARLSEFSVVEPRVVRTRLLGRGSAKT